MTAVQYLVDRIQRKLGVQGIKVSGRRNTWEASCPLAFGSVTLRGESAIEALEALEEHLQKMALLAAWKAEGGLGKETTT